jgi:Uma2 family endonuclease
VLLVIEVSDSTLDFDRRVKLPLYAKAGVAEMWIVDVQAQRVEVYRVPGSDGYREVHVHGVGEAVGVEAVPGVQLTVAEIFE